MRRLPARWVLASGNPGKLREIRTLLGDSGLQIVPQSDLGVVSPEETGVTFVENALLKARHAAAETGLAAIADDSGLAVDALAGAPGIHSARFSGRHGNDQANTEALLEALRGIPDDQRGASFHCVIVALLGPEDPAPLIGCGTWQGSILREPRGSGGFGYDPIFFDPRLEASGGELTADVKNQVSHRSQALAEIYAELQARSVAPSG